MSAISRSARSDSMPGDLLADGAAPVVCTPAEARRVWLRGQRRVLQVGRRRLEVVARGGHVVRRVWMEQRGQVLELAPPRTLLEHPAAVGTDAVRGAVVVGVEQCLHPAEAGGL